jgi:hypothetical protein
MTPGSVLLRGYESTRKAAMAVFAKSWLRIPTKSAGDSERRRPPVPIEAGRGFR